MASTLLIDTAYETTIHSILFHEYTGFCATYALKTNV